MRLFNAKVTFLGKTNKFARNPLPPPPEALLDSFIVPFNPFSSGSGGCGGWTGDAAARLC